MVTLYFMEYLIHMYIHTKIRVVSIVISYTVTIKIKCNVFFVLLEKKFPASNTVYLLFLHV